MDHQTAATKADAISKAEITIISNSKRQCGPKVSGSAMGAPPRPDALCARWRKYLLNKLPQPVPADSEKV